MSDEAGFEVIDVEGSTEVFTGTVVGGTPVSVPSATGGGTIAEFIVDHRPESAATGMKVSCDGGVTFKTVDRCHKWMWTPKGFIKKIVLDAPSGTEATYEVVLNRENPS